MQQLLKMHSYPANCTTAIHYTRHISHADLNKLRSIQNSLARAFTNTSKYKRITPPAPILKILHCFQSRIDLKFHMSDHEQKGFLCMSMALDYGIHFLLIPESHHFFQYSVQSSNRKIAPVQDINMIISTCPTDCHAFGASAPYRNRLVVPLAFSLA